jgi:hypothetical protein
MYISLRVCMLLGPNPPDIYWNEKFSNTNRDKLWHFIHVVFPMLSPFVFDRLSEFVRIVTHCVLLRYLGSFAKLRHTDFHEILCLMIVLNMSSIIWRLGGCFTLRLVYFLDILPNSYLNEKCVTQNLWGKSKHFSVQFPTPIHPLGKSFAS